MPNARPSEVLFGEILGAIRCRPSALPPKYAPVSPANVPARIAASAAPPWSSSRSMIAWAIARPTQKRRAAPRRCRTRRPPPRARRASARSQRRSRRRRRAAPARGRRGSRRRTSADEGDEAGQPRGPDLVEHLVELVQAGQAEQRRAGGEPPAALHDDEDREDDRRGRATRDARAEVGHGSAPPNRRWRRAYSASAALERLAGEVRPQLVGEHELGVRRLPDQEVRQPLLAARADHEVGIVHGRARRAARGTPPRPRPS